MTARLAMTTVAIMMTVPGCSVTGTREQPRPSTTELSGSLSVYAAASLAPVFDDILRQFAAEHVQLDVRPLVAAGSSTLLAQLTDGAPADVIAVADERTMLAALDLGVVDNDAVVVATNTLTMIVPSDNPGNVVELADLASTRLRVVLCAVEVPCGAATQQLLRNNDVDVSAASREQSVSAVLTKVAAGEADAGLVYRTDATRSTDVRAVTTAGADAVVNEYSMATVATSMNPAAARAFIDFVASERGRSILIEHGFGLP